MSLELNELVSLINGWKRPPHFPPLIKIATCAMCGDLFPMLPQDFNRAIEHNHPHICAVDRPKYKRNKRKA